jgi:hypothetical protein
MKGENKPRIVLYSWLPTGNYHKNLTICNLFSSKSGEFGALFPLKNPLYSSKSDFSSQNLTIFLHPKKNTLFSMWDF